MWNALPLVLPVLIPSWRFFKSIEPSPRVQWAFLDGATSTPDQWRNFRPTPQHVSAVEMLRRLFWNPDRNDTLFVVSCAERIQQNPTDHSIQGIGQRIRDEITQNTVGAQPRVFVFRLVFRQRIDDQLVDDILFVSDPFETSP